MWVEKRDKDNYKFVEQYKDPLTGKNKRVSLTLEKKLHILVNKHRRH